MHITYRHNWKSTAYSSSSSSSSSSNSRSSSRSRFIYESAAATAIIIIININHSWFTTGTRWQTTKGPTSVLHNGAGDAQNKPLGKQKRSPPSSIFVWAQKQPPSLLALPSLLVDRMNAPTLTLKPNKLIDDIANRFTKCARRRIRFKPMTRKDILYFLACYYYMGYCRLPARSDYWKQQLSNSCLLSHWMDGIISISWQVWLV